jgi:ketosteroid isomerase-like protein
MFDALARWDIDGMLRCFDDRVALGPSHNALPSHFGTGYYEGHEGVREWMRHAQGLETYTSRPLEMEEHGQHVLVTHAVAAKRQGAGEMGWLVYLIATVEDEKIVRGQTFHERAEALRSIGIPAADG